MKEASKLREVVASLRSDYVQTEGIKKLAKSVEAAVVESTYTDARPLTPGNANVDESGEPNTEVTGKDSDPTTNEDNEFPNVDVSEENAKKVMEKLTKNKK